VGWLTEKVPCSRCYDVLSLLLYSLTEKGAIKTGSQMAIYKCNKYPKRYFTKGLPLKPKRK
jgi:hypothetical protein